MIKIVIMMVLVFLLISCGGNELNKNDIAKWINIENAKNDILNENINVDTWSVNGDINVDTWSIKNNNVNSKKLEINFIEKKIIKKEPLNIKQNNWLSYYSKNFNVSFIFPKINMAYWLNKKTIISEDLTNNKISIITEWGYPKISNFIYKVGDKNKLEKVIQKEINETCIIKEKIKIKNGYFTIILWPKKTLIDGPSFNCFLNFKKYLRYYEKEGVLIYSEIWQESQFAFDDSWKFVDIKIVNSFTIGDIKRAEIILNDYWNWLILKQDIKWYKKEKLWFTSLYLNWKELISLANNLSTINCDWKLLNVCQWEEITDEFIRKKTAEKFEILKNSDDVLIDKNSNIKVLYIYWYEDYEIYFIDIKNEKIIKDKLWGFIKSIKQWKSWTFILEKWWRWCSGWLVFISNKWNIEYLFENKCDEDLGGNYKEIKDFELMINKQIKIFYKGYNWEDKEKIVKLK
jgi:hypothetical protein